MTQKSRSLKIEAVGDFACHQVKPRIRLSGLWLEQAGFKPGHRVEVLVSKPGEMSLTDVMEHVSDRRRAHERFRGQDRLKLRSFDLEVTGFRRHGAA